MNFKDLLDSLRFEIRKYTTPYMNDFTKKQAISNAFSSYRIFFKYNDIDKNYKK